MEEIYDLSKTLDDSIFGFIFLFKWMERKGRRNKAASLDPNSNYVTDPEIVNKIFFAHQVNFIKIVQFGLSLKHLHPDKNAILFVCWYQDCAKLVCHACPAQYLVKLQIGQILWSWCYSDQVSATLRWLNPRSNWMFEYLFIKIIFVIYILLQY